MIPSNNLTPFTHETLPSQILPELPGSREKEEEEPTTTRQWLAAMERAQVCTEAFLDLEVPPKKRLLGDFMLEADLAILYAPRGLGKTWLTAIMAHAIAEGNPCGDWEAGEEPARVLVVDGEMALSQAQERSRLLQMHSKNLHFLHHERLFDQSLGSALNIADPVQQSALTEFIIQRDIKVLFLDNLSCLARGMRENDADDWEMLGPWLLDLRRRNVTVVIVAHAGKTGVLRGTSKREDATNWILKLRPVPGEEGEEAEDGARFVSVFEKNRNSTGDLCPPLLWSFHRGQPVRYESQVYGAYEAFVRLVTEGWQCNLEIAEHLGVSKGLISRWAHKAHAQKRILIRNRKYYPAHGTALAAEEEELDLED